MWRCFSSLNLVHYYIVGGVTGGGIGLAIISYFIMIDMIDRRGLCEQVISKLKAIQQFQSEQKAADPNWKMKWLQEKNAPEGFKERKRK